MRATFSDFDHCINEGWATYHTSPRFRFRLRCWLGRHIYPTKAPDNPNPSSPWVYDRCPRCRAHLKWFVEGQHRYGGYDLR